MVTRTLFVVGTLAALSGVGAQEKPHMKGKEMGKHDMSMMHKSAWKEMDAFHSLLGAAYHPAAEKKDLTPLRAKADALAAAAREWAASTPPSACATEAVRSTVATISTDALAIGNQVLAAATDAELTTAITALHTKFEGVEKQCGSPMKGMKH